ncbi:MAG: carbamoyltransferase [Gammaproteobacteria bacterium]|nr:carbamoyltransferase [Gammaproteobacteria bacterium]MCP5424707.1 carbamoyltransferase [Gammaproteobacteria bacterium]MCP5459258.1 carbamoyltransferase [Gammaproteobacteria bacterium]
MKSQNGRNNRYILGLNAFHGDSSACLVREGQLLAAAEEERFRRIKHWAGFPSEAIRYCLGEAGITLNDVGHVAINSDPRANLLKKIRYTLGKRPDLNLVRDRIRNIRQRAGVTDELKQAFPGQTFDGQVHHIEHHLAHLASCFLVSPFHEAVAVSVDGFGDFASSAWGAGRGASITVDERIYFPHSLGIFYQALTQYLGFPHYGDEYKIMGLAPYGEPRFIQEMREIVRLRDNGSFALDLRFFRHHKEKIDYRWRDAAPAVGDLFADALQDLLGPRRQPQEPLEQRHKDLARSVQAMYEEAFFHLLNSLHRRYGLDTVVLAGGCAMNSVANGKVIRQTPFNRVYIQSAAGDAGGALGAAYVVWQKLAGPGAARSVMDHAYWGPAYRDADFSAVLQAKASEWQGQGCTMEHIDDETTLCRRTAEAIADAKVVGWFQGRMEWGPRALGNRSIVCDPRRADMKDILNQKIKRRESFRPFAPSILREAVPDWFEADDDVPFMMKVYPIREEKRASIPAVAHVDGSGRLQTVYEQTNPRYYRLIKEFASLTGVPMVLNTSFNENEPVVCTPDEALDCFLRTKMDVLVLGQYFLIRASNV